VAAITDIVAVHAAGVGLGLTPAVRALHLRWLIQVFEISATNQAAGWSGGHDEGVLQEWRIKISIAS